MTQEKKNYTLPIIVMFLLFFMIAFVTGFQNPFGVILKEQLSLSNFQSQIGNFANFIAYAFMGLPAGMILQKKGYKFSAILAVVFGLVGVGLMLISSTLDAGSVFTIYLIGAFVAGFSMCVLNTVVNPMLNTLGGGGKKGNQLLQFGGSLNSLGATICPILVGYFLGGSVKGATLEQGRAALFVAFGIFVLAFIVLAFSKLPEPILEEIKALKEKEARETAHLSDEERAKRKKTEPSLAGVFKFRHYVLGVVAIFLYVGVEVGIPNMANLYMTGSEAEGGLNMAATVATALVGIYWLLMLIGRFVGGMIGGSVSSRTMLTCVAVLALLFLCGAIFCNPEVKVPFPGYETDPSFSVGMYDVSINIIFLVLCGLCTSIMWGGIFNLAVEGLGKYTAVGSGFFMVMVCGGGVLPLIQGVVADACGFLASYWVLVAAVAYLLFYALVGSRVSKNAINNK
jgi:FHS family L-fucose permease-like MFS transporter